MPEEVENLSQFIRRQLFLGLGKNEVTNLILKKRGISKLGERFLNELFQNLAQDQALGANYLTSQHCVILHAVHAEFQLAKRGVTARSCYVSAVSFSG